jgi:replication-associated recombination protein RarA
MELKCQQETIEQLTACYNADVHSIILYGQHSSGKTYLSKKYADMLGIEDFYIIPPKVVDIRETIEECYQIDTKVVLCIENLDLGVIAASSTLLKFFEEPAPHIYIIITARSLKRIQDTIISRSHVIGVNIPTDADLVSYAEEKYPDQYRLYSNRDLWKSIKTFDDVDVISAMDSDAINYIESIPELCFKATCVSDALWSLQKYPDNKGDTPIDIIIRYIVYKYPALLYHGAECIRLLEQKRISNFAILSKFLFNIRNMR